MNEEPDMDTLRLAYRIAVNETDILSELDWLGYDIFAYRAATNKLGDSVDTRTVRIAATIYTLLMGKVGD